MSEAWNIRFGTAGTSDSFAAQGYKSSLDVPEYTAKMGLNAFEYQCGRGVRLGLDKAARMAALAAERDILFSVHAPYYISMSSLEEDKRLNSIQYLLQSAAVCRALGGRRIIFHSGSCGKQSREAALEKALDTMRRAVAALDEAGFEDMTLCPETMGKVGQLGTLDEVLALCGVDSRITPCIDFGHLTPARWAVFRPRRIMPPFWTAWPRCWAMTVPGSSMCTFPASSTRRAAKSATGPLPIPSSARSPSPDGAAGTAPADPGGHLRECGHTGRGRADDAANVRAARNA